MTLKAWQIALATTMTLLVPSVCSAATVTAERVAISPDHVADALAATHVTVRGSQVQLLSEVTARNAAALLKVTRIEKWNEDSALARIRCADSTACMPFYVLVHFVSAQDRDAALAPPARGKKPVFVALRQQPLVRAGDQAVLIANTDRFHASIPIICLQNGAQGQKVRVATLNRKKIAMAEVIDSGVLKGSFSAE
jgi:hypothetical protein